MALIIESLDSSRHTRSTFQCGKDSLDRYLRQQASQDERNKIARVFVLINTESTHPLEIMGYYALSFYAVKKIEFDESFIKRLPRYSLFPATLLGRLAIDQKHKGKGKGLGELLLFDSFHKALQASRQVASLAIVVEAIDEDSARFYQKYKFIYFFQRIIFKILLSYKRYRNKLSRARFITWLRLSIAAF